MKRLAELFKNYTQLLGTRFYLIIFLGIIAILLETVGIGVFLPLMQGDQSSGLSRRVLTLFESVGIAYESKYLIVLFAVFFVFRSGFLILQKDYLNRVCNRRLTEIRVQLMKLLFGSKYEHFQSYSIGNLNQLMFEASDHLMGSMEVFIDLLVNGMITLVYFGIPLMMYPKEVGVLILILIPFFLLMKRLNIKTKQLSFAHHETNAHLQTALIQGFRNFKYFKATASEPSILRLLSQRLDRLMEIRLNERLLGVLTQYAFEPVAVVVIAGSLYLNAQQGNQNVSGMLFSLFLIYRALTRIISLQSVYRKLLFFWAGIHQTQKALSSLTTVQDESPVVSQKNSGGMLFDRPIYIENVSFKYQERDEHALRGLSLTIEPLSTVGIVGASGSGKTTLLNLLVKIFRPISGKIRMGDDLYSEIPDVVLRSQVGYISQEPAIFTGTLLQNLTLWKDPISLEEMSRIEEALKSAQLTAFVSGLAGGLRTLISDDGSNLSGGQRQRISIARELLKNPKLLILDEATSALDLNTESEIMDLIYGQKGKRTTLIVTHRISTLKKCDQIHVLKNGVLVQSGTYEELSLKSDEFRRIAHLGDPVQ